MNRQSLIARFAHWTTARPWRRTLFLSAIAAVAVGLAAGIEFRSSFLALLPEGAKEVRDLKHVLDRAGSNAQLVIAVEGQAQRRLIFSRRVVERLRSSGLVAWADVELPVEFFAARAIWLQSLAALTDIDKGLEQTLHKARARQNPAWVDLEADGERTLPPTTFTTALQVPSATTTSKDGRYLFITVKPHASASQLGQGRLVLAGIKSIVAQLLAEENRAAPAGQTPLAVGYAGSLQVNQAQHQRIGTDMALAAGVSFALIVLLVVFWTRRMTAPLIIGLPLLLGVALTLAVARLTVGHLNLVSGFLVAALFGLGVDFGVHLYSAYLRARDDQGSRGSKPCALRRAIAETFAPCATAAMTTAVAFASLTFADFRGFSEYGAIAAGGVLITLMATFIALPPLTLLLDRRQANPAKVPRSVRRISRSLALTMVGLAVVFSALSLSQLGDLRYENNFRRLQGRSPEATFSDYVGREVGRSLSPAVLMVGGFDQAQIATRIVERRVKRDAALGRVFSLASLVPHNVDKKRLLISRLSGHAHSLARFDLDNAQRKEIKRLERGLALGPWSAAEVPPAFRRRLLSLDERQHLILLWPTHRMHRDEDLLRWAAALDGVAAELGDAGVEVHILDENRIAARVLALVRADGPRILLIAALAVLFVLLVHFRRLDQVLMVIGALGLGIVAMCGVLVLFDERLNLFSVVVLPTIVGVGIDNAVHIVHAYGRQRSVVRIMNSVGKAALLSSVTTAIGVGAAIGAHHAGIASMGTLALIGIASTFCFTTVALPALLGLFDRPEDQLANAGLAMTQLSSCDSLRFPQLDVRQ